MQKFERFIIYPMLFIALFFSFAGDGMKQIIAKDFFNEIITKKITVMNNDTEEVMTLEGTDNGGVISLHSQKNKENIIITTGEKGRSFIAVKKPNNEMGIVLSSVDNETALRVYGPLKKFYDVKNEEYKESSISLISNEENNSVNIRGKTENNALTVGNNDGYAGVIIGNRKDYGGVVATYDTYGDQMVEIGKNGGNDGAIFIYDKYNEKYGAYSYGGYAGDFKNK